MLVVNTKSNAEVWIPRQYLGEVSKIDEPVMIVGLLKELEYKAGMIWPFERRVLEMPRAAGESLRLAYPGTAEEETPPAATGKKKKRGGDGGPESNIGRLIAFALIFGVLACFVVVSIFRSGAMRPKVTYTARDQSFLELKRDDGYFEVIRKLGNPSEDRWRPGKGELQFRVLVYKDRGYTAVLMGTEQQSATYIGCVDQNWHVVHAVDSPRGDSTLSLLRNLKPF